MNYQSENAKETILLIVYNLPEAANQSLDEETFADLCKAIVDVDVNIQKMHCIGCKHSSR